VIGSLRVIVPLSSSSVIWYHCHLEHKSAIVLSLVVRIWSVSGQELGRPFNVRTHPLYCTKYENNRKRYFPMSLNFHRYYCIPLNVTFLTLSLLTEPRLLRHTALLCWRCP